MCGINGFTANTNSVIRAMNAAIRHRGPDDEGAYCTDGLSLGHVRLAVQDTGPLGHQPMGLALGGTAPRCITDDNALEQADFILVYNGEIYNFTELQSGLGGGFQSRCDAEVLLRAYVKWGAACVQHFNGMWAFCLFDRRQNRLFLSRDRFGQKPLYYHDVPGQSFAFSSELKGLIVHQKLGLRQTPVIDPTALDFYFAGGFIPAPVSIYKNIRKLPAGENLIYDLSEKRIIRLNRYYDLPPYAPRSKHAPLLEETRHLLDDAVRLRLRSDVPLGVMLSGGLDSGVIAATAAKFQTRPMRSFTMGFSGPGDERALARIAAAHVGTHHHEEFFDESALKKTVDDYAFTYCEPFADYAGLPLLLLSKATRSHVTVALSGDGGDEAFGGYDQYRAAALCTAASRFPVWLHSALAALLKSPGKKARAGPYYKIAAVFRAAGMAPEAYIRQTTFGYAPEAYREWQREHFSRALELSGTHMSEAVRIFDVLAGTIPDAYMTKVDRASMACGLEIRSPLLDYRIIELAQEIPAKLKATLFFRKILFREIAAERLPAVVARRRKKTGFTPPFAEWIHQGEYQKEIALALGAVFDTAPQIRDWYEKTKNSLGAIENDLFQIRLYLFGRWRQRWMT